MLYPKEDRINKVAETKAKEFEELRAKADSLSSGVKIFFNERGQGVQPKEGDKILMNYAGYLNTGHLFQSNVLENAEKYEMVDDMRKAAGQYIPIPTEYSKNAQLIPGFKEGLLNMKVGDKTTLFIPSHLAYGPRGMPGVIPPDSELVFELEIVGMAE